MTRSSAWGAARRIMRRAWWLIWTTFGLLLVQAAAPAQAQPPWTGWQYVSTLAVQNSVASSLPAGYTVQLVFDTAALVSQGRLRADCADLRVSYVGGGPDVELDRLVTDPNTGATTVTFRTQAVIAPSGSDVDYRLHYGNELAGDPPANPVNVYAFYDDFQDGDAAGWTTKGTWSVVADGGNHVYRYSTGGANWALAYAPVTGLSDLDCVARVRATNSPMTNWIGLAFRIQNSGNFLTFYQSRDQNMFKYARIVSDNHTILAQPPYTMVAGTWYRVRLQALGTTIRARIWQDGAIEPATWLIATTEAAYQTSSNIGATLYNHTTSADWDDFKVRRLVASEPTVTVVADEYTLTVNTTGSGTVTRVPDQATYHYGEVVTLTAAPAEGWTFAGWSGGLVGNPTAVTITGNTTVTASFAMTVAPWWSGAWGYRARVTVTNTSGTELLPIGYSTRVLVDAAALVGAGQMLGSGADLRVVGFDGLVNTEFNRVVENAGTSQTEVWFRLPRAIGPGGHDDGFFLYYGNPSAGPPPADGSQVFLFYEDWEQGTAHWTNAGGLDAGNTGTMGLSVVSTLEAFSPGHSQQFPKKASGGDAFCGYVPVAAGQSYAIGVWARSATGAHLPVGVDPYDAGRTKGAEIWLWTNEWTVGAQWSARSARFTAPGNAAFIKIKSEWWDQGPGTAPVYLDDLHLRYAVGTEPAIALGPEEGSVPGPVISNATDTGPVNLGGSVTVTATVGTTAGVVDAVTLRLVSPESRDVAMSLIAGDGTSGDWQAQCTPSQGGTYIYRVLAHSTAGRSTLSPARTFQVSDTQAPQIALVSVVNPILVKDLQTLVVDVTDNGQVGTVTVTVDGVPRAMTPQGNQYSYSWRVTAVGTIRDTVRATDSAGNTAELVVTFVSQAREVDVATWLGGKAGAASWSIDDGNSGCLAALQSAGIRGTYYYNGGGAPGWLASYSAAGQEIGSHSVGHPCDVPACTPTCTPEGLWQIPFAPEDMIAYRRDQLDPNVAAIEAATGKPVVTMAWPCGCADARRMTAAGPYFLGVRGYYDYIAQLAWVQDVNTATPAEFMNLNSSNSYNQAHIDQAIAEGKWAIITSHGACDGISYIASRQSVLWVAPVGEVLEYIKVRDAAQFSNYSRAGRLITFDVAHNLPPMLRQQVDLTPLLPIVFDNPVTLKAHILDSDVVLGVEIDGQVVSHAVIVADGTRYVAFDAALNAPRHVAIMLSAPLVVLDQVTDDGPTELGDAVRVTARATVAEGAVHDVILHVTAPQTLDLAMTLVGGTTDTYEASFVPDRAGSYNCHVSAANDQGATSQSAQHGFLVQDTQAPQWRALAQTLATLPVGGTNTLSAEGRDGGGLRWAILATDESGTWQEFDWAASGWWDHRWAKRRAVTLRETAGLARSSEIIDVPVSTAEFPGLNDCAAELRVADAAGNEVPCQVYGVQTAGGVTTCHLLFQADIGPGAASTYYIYYGNPTATAPGYVTDLVSGTSGGVMTVGNAFLNLDLNVAGGVVSRIRLPGGTNADLPLASQSNRYWGWHQVCSSLDGNITGINSLCSGGIAPATGLVLATVVDGPVAKVFEFTSQKGVATYRMTYRFFAHAPYYQYDLARDGTSASVMNSFWYQNGSYTRLGEGSGGTPSSTYNTYDDGADHLRLASLAAVDHGSIDGTDNDGTQLGAADYRFPSASGLSLYVTTGSTQAAAEEVVARRAAPPTLELGAVEDAPATRHGSPVDAGGATDWAATTFTWQNAAIPDGTVIHWRVRYCDMSGNCGVTDEMSFRVQSQSTVAAVVPSGQCLSGARGSVTVPVMFTRNESAAARAVSVGIRLSPELRLVDAAQPVNSVRQGSWLTGYTSAYQVVDLGGGAYQVDQTILGSPCGMTAGGELFTLEVTQAGGDGTGTITVADVTARTCSNATIESDPGAVATITIDHAGPGPVSGLSASGSGGVGAAAGTRQVVLAFTVPPDAAAVEVYRAPFGSYPLYGRSPGTGHEPAAPAGYPPPAPWVQVPGLSGPGTDDPGTRDQWYYVVATRDGCGNATYSGRTTGSLNYVLGDVHGGSVDCAGDNAVTTSDIGYLGAHYGVAVGSGEAWTCLDVGPTTDYWVTSRPVPDGLLDFEDLAVFAIDYGTVVTGPAGTNRAAAPVGSKAAAGLNAVGLQVPQSPREGETFAVGVVFEGDGAVRALSVDLRYEAAVVEPVGVEDGVLLGAQSVPHVTLSSRPGNVDVGLLGGGLAGRGVVAWVRFRVVGPGEAGIALERTRARDGENREVALGKAAVASAPPTATSLSAAMPTPFRDETTFELALARGGAVTVVVYGVDGRAVRTLASGWREAGTYRMPWDGRDDGGRPVPAGLYFARLITSELTTSRTVVRMR